MKAVKQTLDERCNETIEEIYRIAIKLIIETIAEGYGEDRPDVGGPLSTDDDPRRESSDENGNNAGAGSGNKSSGGHLSPSSSSSHADGTRDGEASGGGGGASSSYGRQASDDRRQINSVHYKGEAEQLRDAAITSQSGENSSSNNNNQQKLDDNSECPADGASCEPTMKSASKQRPVAWPAARSRQKNQGQICRSAENDNDNNCSYSAGNWGGGGDDDSKELSEDRLQTTIMCLRELLALAMKGAADQQKLQQKRDIVVGCEKLKAVRNEDEANKKKENNQLEPDIWRSPKEGDDESRTNELATSIGCNFTNENNKSNRRQKRRGSLFNVDRMLDCLSRLLITNSRKPSTEYNDVESMKLRTEAAAAATPTTTDRVQVNGERQDASQGKRAHLIERRGWLAPLKRRLSPLLFARRSGDVVKRKSRANSDCITVVAPAAANSCHEHDSSGSETCKADKRCLSSSSRCLPNEASSGSYRGHELSSCVTIDAAAAAITSTTHVSQCRARGSDNDLKRRAKQNGATKTTSKPEQTTMGPRSPIEADKRSASGSTSHRDAGSCRRLTTSLLHPIDDDDCSSSQLDEDWDCSGCRSTTRPCNESSKLSSSQLPTKVAAGLHSRDRLNNNRNNLGGPVPNELPFGQQISANARLLNGNHCEQTDEVCLSSPSSYSSYSSYSSSSSSCSYHPERWFRIKQSSSLAIRGRIVMPLLSRARKFHFASSDSAICSAKPDDCALSNRQNERRTKVNENEDLFEAEPGGCAPRECHHHHDQHQQPVGAHIASESSQFAMSGHYDHEEQTQLNLTTGQRVSHLASDQQIPTSTTTTEAAPIITKDQIKQTHSTTRSRPRLMSADRSAVLSRLLTSNAGDLGELIKMLMLTLLTATSSSSLSS